MDSDSDIELVPGNHAITAHAKVALPTYVSPAPAPIPALTVDNHSRAVPSSSSSQPLPHTNHGSRPSKITGIIHIDSGEDDQDPPTPPPPLRRVASAPSDLLKPFPPLGNIRFDYQADDGDDEELPDITAHFRGVVNSRPKPNLAKDKGKQRAVSPLPPSSSPKLRSRPDWDLEVSRMFDHHLNDEEYASQRIGQPQPKKRRKSVDAENGLSKTQLKEQERLAKKEAKDKEKAEKAAAIAREKETKKALKTCNVLEDRTSTCKEIIVDISSALLGNSAFENKIYPFLSARYDEIYCEHSKLDRGRKPDPRCHPMTIHWRRRVIKDWNAKARYWLPRHTDDYEIQEQATVLIYLTVHDIEEAAQNHKDKNLLLEGRGFDGSANPNQDSDTLIDIVRKARAVHGPHYQIFLLIQNLSEKARAKRSADNANWQAEARGAAMTASGARKGKKVEKWKSSVTMEEIEDELARIVIAERCFLVRAEKYEQTVDWLVEITKDVSYKPYKLIERAREASLNIDGKVKSSEGGSYAKTYINQLACITGVTDATARAIAQEYPTWRLLLDAYKRCVSEHDKKVLLDGIAIGNTLSGAATDRCIGKALSEKIYIVLFTNDKNLDLTGDIQEVRSRVQY